MRVIYFLSSMFMFCLAVPIHAQTIPNEKPMQFSLVEAKGLMRFTNKPYPAELITWCWDCKEKGMGECFHGTPPGKCVRFLFVFAPTGRIIWTIGRVHSRFWSWRTENQYLWEFSGWSADFSGQYLIGVKAAKVYANMSVLADTKSRIA